MKKLGIKKKKKKQESKLNPGTPHAQRWREEIQI